LRIPAITAFLFLAVAATSNAATGWGLDRIDQHKLPLSQTYSRGHADGAGVTIYIVDTGVTNIAELGGRLRSLSVPGVVDTDDSANHGTPVASIAAGTTVGVAPHADIVNVRAITDASGVDPLNIQHVIDAIQAIDDDFLTLNPPPEWTPGTHCSPGQGVMRYPGVVNMSITFDRARFNTPTQLAQLDQLEAAIQASIAKGLVYVVGAGNGRGQQNFNVKAADASEFTPARLGNAACEATITVGGTAFPASSGLDRLGSANTNRGFGWATNVGPAVTLFAPGDNVDAFSKDGTSLLFSGTSAATPYVTGAVARYLMANVTTSASPSVAYSPADIRNRLLLSATQGAITNPNTTVFPNGLAGAQNALLFAEPAKGDFDGDLRPEIVWRNSSTGANALWMMKDTTYTSTANLPGLAGNFAIQGTADFNGDGKQDILWRNFTTGANALWLMNDTSFSGIINLPPIPDTLYYVGGIADFDGDGNADILWRNDSTGANAIWIMSGTNFTGTIVNLPGLPGNNFHFEGATDFDGDGFADILIRNYENGNNAVWLMNGTSYASTVNLPALPDVGYHIGGVADYNGDGWADILWHSETTQANAVWRMNGTAYLSTVDFNTIPNPDYHMQGPR
jgi:hypothetical protein